MNRTKAKGGETGMNILSELNSSALYLISGGIILVIMAVCALFMARAYKAGLALGMSRQTLKKTITSSATFTLLPSVSILLGVIALSGSLGIPLPWLRLSVIGALHYETNVADIAARSIGMSGLTASEMTATAFVTIALLMTVGIIWGMVLNAVFGKRYLRRLQRPGEGKKKGPGFGDAAMSAMFIGLVSAYIGSYVGTLTSTGDYMPLFVLGMSAAAMALFLYLIEKRKVKWLESFSVAGSMLIAMAAAVALKMIV